VERLQRLLNRTLRQDDGYGATSAIRRDSRGGRRYPSRLSILPGISDAPKPAGFRKGLISYGNAAFSLFLRTAFIKGAGYTDDALARPIVGIINTGSGNNPCHGNATELIAAVRRGIMLAGGLPVEFPTISLHESFAHPTSMYLRNLMAMETEEMIRS
jgi:dihydroxy-acid dehydratase